MHQDEAISFFVQAVCDLGEALATLAVWLPPCLALIWAVRLSRFP